MDFYEDDEPVEKVVEAFERGEKKRTEKPVGFSCQHMTLTAGPMVNFSSLRGGCGCTMQAVYA